MGSKGLGLPEKTLNTDQVDIYSATNENEEYTNFILKYTDL